MKCMYEVICYSMNLDEYEEFVRTHGNEASQLMDEIEQDVQFLSQLLFEDKDECDLECKN